MTRTSPYDASGSAKSSIKERETVREEIFNIDQTEKGFHNIEQMEELDLTSET